MSFCTLLFLTVFLPAALAIHWVIPKASARNLVLLLASLLFYAAGEHVYVFVLVGLACANYWLGLWVSDKKTKRSRLIAVTVGVAANIAVLAGFKYVDFAIETANSVLTAMNVPQVASPGILPPIGISFITFQAISYLVDIYHERVVAERSFVRVGLYLALFPKIIAGPITKYGSLLPEFIHRRLSSENMADGAKRFIVGLAKKVIVADTLGVPVASIFGLPPERLTTELAWFGICCYTLQIYFDFSGYTDMAIGLGRMFGLHLPENFRYPYASQSIREFWRRWHITLSEWFRDYVYIPLGGSRCTPLRIYTNLFTVFFLCGLWHGAGWNFVIWGLLHGTLMVVERLGLERVLQKVPRAMRWLYAMGSVTIAWVFFRCDTLSDAMDFLAAMFGMGRGDATAYHLGLYLSTKLVWAFAVGVLGSLPLVPLLKARIERTGWTAVRVGVPMVEAALYVCMLFGGMMDVAAGTFRPFVYAQF